MAAVENKLTLSEARVKRFLESWAANKALAPTAVGVVAVLGSTSLSNLRTQAWAQYFFEVAAVFDVALVLTQSELVITSPRDEDCFSFPATIDSLSVKYVKAPAQDTAAAFAQVCDTMKAAAGPFATVTKELGIQEGATFAEPLRAAIETAGVELVDAAAFFSACLVHRDEAALACMTKAAALATSAMKKFAIPEMEKHISSETPTTLKAFAEAISQRLDNPQKLPGLEAMNVDNFAMAFDPVLVQSGGTYNLALPHGEPSDDPIQGDCICIGLGVRHTGYQAYIGRTFIVENNTSPDYQKAYEAVVAIWNKLVETLRPGVKLCDVYTTVKNFASEAYPDFAPHLGKHFGFSTGRMVLEADWKIHERSQMTVAEGMTFVLRLQLEGVRDSAAPEGSIKRIAVLLADTVAVTATGVDILTKAKRDAKDVVYKEAEEEVKVEAEKRDLRNILRKTDQSTFGLEEQRKQLQKRILEEKKAESSEGGSKGAVKDETKVTELSRLAAGEVNAYRSADSLPAKTGNVIEVDRARECLWLPIQGKRYPFHISTVQKIDVKTESANVHAMIVVFYNTQESNPAYQKWKKKVFIRDVTFRGGELQVFQNIALTVRECQAIIKARDQHRKQLTGVVEQKGLQPNKSGTFPRIRDVKCRPNPAPGRGKAAGGDFEAHENGFRFVHREDSPMVILYNNVKHFIFQPSDNEQFTIVHLKLKNAIMVGKKKAEDVQFVAEVMDESEGLRTNRKSWEEEVEADEKERDRVTKTNTEFLHFAKKVEEVSGLKPEIPFKKFDFHGSVNRGMARLRATENCLVSLMEPPFYVQSMRDVEVASLERVIMGQKNFDIVFVHKGYQTTSMVSTISMKVIELVKDWLNTTRTIYFESTVNIQWPALLKQIREDDDWEPWGEDGWQAYLDSDNESGEEGEESSEESDSSFAYDSDEETEETEEDSDWAEEVSEGSSSSYGSTESGEDWSDLEKKAEAEDRGRGSDSESSGAKRKKRKTQTSAKPASKAAPPRRR